MLAHGAAPHGPTYVRAILRQPKALGLGGRRSGAQEHASSHRSRGMKNEIAPRRLLCEHEGQEQVHIADFWAKNSPGLSSRARPLSPQSISDRTS
jgi:hypothetical protein